MYFEDVVIVAFTETLEFKYNYIVISYLIVPLKKSWNFFYKKYIINLQEMLACQ